MIIWEGMAGAGRRNSWSGPSGATMRWADDPHIFFDALGDTDLWTGADALRAFQLWGIFRVGATAGNRLFTIGGVVGV